MKTLCSSLLDACHKLRAFKRINISALIITAVIFFINSNPVSGQCTVIGNPSSGQRGSDFCAPVTKQVWYRFDFATKPPATSYRVLYFWGDGSANQNLWPTVQYESLFPGDTTWYVLIEPIHTYIENDGVCDYVTTMVLVDTNGAQCGDSRQTQEIASWHTDDVAPAQGYIDITPDIKEVCEGDSLINFPFIDASSFACNVNITDIRKPNNQPRHVQFVYNTNPTGGQGIPDLYIDVYGTKVILTDENGNPVANSWTVNPLDGSTVVAYSTNSGYFEGPVISTGFNPVGGSQSTFPISFPGTTTVAGDYMEVTVRNWNFCNPWNTSQTNPNAGDAKTDIARIVIIDAPEPPTVPDKTICEGGDRELTVTSAPVGDLRWYSDQYKTTHLTTGATYTPPDVLPGEYSFWVGDLAVSGNGCESQLTEVTLTIREPLPQPGTITGPTDICVNATGLTFSLALDPADMPFGGPTEYIWSVPGGWNITNGQGSKEITVTAGGATGAQQVSVVRSYTTAPDCPGDPQTHTVTVYAQPVAQTIIKNPDATEVCTNGNVSATFTGGSGGVSPTDVYQSSTDGGNTWSAYTPGSNISSAITGADRLQIRTRRESAGAGCANSEWNTVTWDVVEPPVAQTIIKNPDVADVCTNGSVSATFTGGSGGVNPVDVYQSSTNGGSTWSSYTPGTSISSSSTGTNRIQIRTRRTSSGTGCTDSDWNVVTWNVVAQPVSQNITKDPNVTTICTGGEVSATFTGGSGGVDPVDVYQSTIDGGTTWQAYIPGTTLSSAIAGTNRIRVRTRRTSAGTGCNTSAWRYANWTVVEQPVAQTITKNPDVTDVCTGGTVSATFSGGSGGVSPVDVYESSIDGGSNWAAYTPGNPLSSATPGTDRIQVRTRRESSGTGCANSGYNTVSWTVVAQPVAQTITKNPDVAEVCTGGSVSATFSGGSGGVSPVDVYQSSTDGGNTWSAYTPGNSISSATIGTDRLQIRTRRESSGHGCIHSDWNTVTWNVVPQPVAQTITKNPNITDVCTGGTVSATFSGGSGGVSPVDIYQSSTNGGSTWSVYIPGNSISSASAGVNRLQIRTRRTSAGTGCTDSDWNTVTWNVVAQPTGPTLNTKTPNLAEVCAGELVSATFNAGSGGVGCSDAFQYRFDGAGGWTIYTPGDDLNTSEHSLVEIQGQRAGCTAGTGCTGTAWVTLAQWDVNPLPTPSISGDNNVCENDAGKIYSTAPDAGSTFLWEVSGGTISGGQGTADFSVDWGLAGDGWVKVTQTITATSCSFTTPYYAVVINPGEPTETPTADGPSAACLSAVNVTITSTEVATAIQYEWDTPTGSVITGGTTLSYSINGLAEGDHDFRVRGLNGCGEGPWSDIYTLTIVAQPVAQTITKDPNVAEVCTGGSVSATFSGGSGGVSPVDVYESSIDGGTTWSAYTPGTGISSAVAGTDRIQIRTRRESTGAGCVHSGYNTVTWTVVAQPVAQTINKNPDVAEVCTGGSVSATFSGGSGGISPVDVYESSIDGGTTWSAYTPGTGISSAVTGTNRIQIRTRRESTAHGCVHSEYNTVTWTVIAQPVAQTITKDPNVTQVCTGGSVSATFSGGSGGVSPVDVYESSVDGGTTWSAYTPGTDISSAITGTNRIQIRTRRESTGTGCVHSGYNTVTWTVVAQPVAQTITKDPNVTEVCTGGSVSATFSGGSGGISSVDVYESSIDGGNTWSAYTPGTGISSAVAGTDRIQIRTRRESTGTGCVHSDYNTVTWTVVAQPVAQAITKNPDVTEVCTGGSVSATFSGGSGGVSPVDVYESSTDGGTTWSAYIPGTGISSAVTGTDRIQIRTRRESTGTGCVHSGYNTVTWTVVAQPVAQTITKNPNVTEVCTGGSVSATFSGGSGGVSPVDVYESSVDGGATWSAYTPGTGISSAVAGTDRIQIRTRRESTGTGCVHSGYNTVTWTVVTQPVAQTITKDPNVTEVCTGGSVSATFSGGSGGISSVDVYESSIDGGTTWSAYTPGTGISSAVTGTNRIQIRTRRESTAHGCVHSEYNTVTWTVVAQPVAQSVLKNPNVAEVCTGGSVSATFSGGSGGVSPVDVYESSIDGGTTWSAYTPGTGISSAVTGTDRIQIRTRRESTGTGCTHSGYNTVTWTVVAQPVAQNITKTPDVAEVCTGGTVSATFSGGSGGVSPVDVYESSIDGGFSWSAYIPGTNISSAVAGTNRIQIRTRRESTGTGCVHSGYNTVTWTVVAQPVAQTITKDPNVTEVCTGGSVSATFSGGSGGVSPVDIYESSIDGGTTWSAYSPGNNISSAITGTNRIQIRTRRESTGTGCVHSEYNTVTWTVVAQPVAQTITKDPDVTEVCTGGTVSATFTGGSGGVSPVDVYQSSIDGGATWSAYTPGTDISSAVTGTNRIQIRTRRESTGTGCLHSDWNTVTWNVVAQPVAQNITKNPDVIEVCTNGPVSATFSGGSGGVSPADVYQSSIDGGATWSVYVPGTEISSAITGTNRIQIRTRRESTGTGCMHSAWNTATWNVAAQPVAQNITKTPNVSDICINGNVSATFSGGSGGISPVDVYESSIDGGATWSAYTPGSNITSAIAGANRIQIRTRRESAGTGCTYSDWNTVTWNVMDQPVAQSIVKNPDAADVCVNNIVSATFSGGSGGVSPVDIYQSSVNGGSTWLSYTPGNNLSSAVAGADRIQVRTMRQSTGFGCVNSGWNTETWTVIPEPTSYAGPNAVICANETHTLSDATATTYSLIEWSSAGDGSFSDINLLNPVYTPGANDKVNGSVVLTIKAIGAGPCVSVEALSAMTLTINPLPVTSPITGKSIICEDATSEVYQVNEPRNPGATYAWTVPPCLTITSPPGFYFIFVDATGPSTPGDKITVTETNPTTGCVGIPVELPITVTSISPGVDVAGPTDVCRGDEEVEFSVPFTDGSTYSWTLPPGAAITSSPNLHLIKVTFNMVGTGEVSVIETSGTVCNTVHNPLTVTIHPLPTVYNLTAPVAYCDGDAGVTITLSNSQTGVNYQLYNSLGTDGPPLPGNDGTPLTWTPKTTETYYVIATNTVTNCSQMMNGTVSPVINFVMGGEIGTDQTICEGTSPLPFTSTENGSGGGSVTYQWQVSSDNVTFTDISGATSAVYSPSALNQDTWYKRTAFSTMGTSVCSDESNVIMVTINSFDPGSIGDVQTICEGTEPGPLTSVSPTGKAGAVFTYQWKNSADGVNFSNIDGAVDETFTPPALTQDTWYKRAVTSTLNGKECVLETNMVRITVVNFSAGSIGSDQTICSGSAPAMFTSVAASGDGSFAYRWQDSPDGVDFTNIDGATMATYSAPTLTSDTWYRRVVTATVNGIPCTAETNIIKVTVNNLLPGAIYDDQTICEGITPDAFTSDAATGDGDITYIWQVSLDGSNYSNITGALLETYAPGALTQDTWYKRQAISTLNSVQCAALAVPVKVTVNNLTAGSVSGTQTICEGDIPAAFTNVAATGDGDITYQWQESTNGTDFTDIGGEVNAGYTVTDPILQDTWYRRLAISTIGANKCTKESNTIKVTVNNFIPGSIGTDQTICEGTMPAALTSVTPTGDGAFAYRWLSSADGTAYSEIPGAISETYSPGILTADTWYRREVKSTLSGKACVDTTNEVLITVVNFNPGSISEDQTICEGDTPAELTSADPSGDGAFTYQWRSSNDGFNYLNIDGATEPTYTPGALMQDTWYIRRVTATLGGTSCMKETNAVRVTVNNVNGGTIIADQTICIGSDPVAFISVVNGTGDGTVTYRWQSSINGTDFIDIDDADANNYDAPPLTEDTWYRRITTSLLNGQECFKMSNIVKITVNQIQAGVIEGSQTICYGQTPDPFTSTDDGGGNGTVTYQWMRSDNDVFYSNIAGATSPTYTPGIHYMDTYYKRMIRSVLNGVVCTEETNVIKVSVNPLPSAILTGGDIICAGETAILNVNLPTGTGPFELEIDKLGIVEDYNSGDDIPVSPVETTIYRLLRVTDANTCEVNSPSGNLMGTAMITVKALPVITASPKDSTICESAMATFSVTATGDDISYQWYVDKNDGDDFQPVAEGGIYFGTATPSLMIIGAGRQMNGYSYQARVSGCGTTAISDSAVLTVNTSPEISAQPTDVTICMGEDVSISVTADGTAPLIWQWQVDPRDGFGFRTLSDTAGIYSGTGTSQLDITDAPRRLNNHRYRAIITGTCSPPATTTFAVLTVNTPPEIINPPVADTICEFTSVNFSVNVNGANLSFIWQESIGGGIFNDLSDGGNYIGTNTSSMNIFNVDRTKDGNRYRVLIIGDCNPPASSDPVLLTVRTSPVVTVPPKDTTVCQNNSAGFRVTAEGSDLQYQWQVSTGGSYSAIADGTVYSGTSTPELTILNADPVMNNNRYRVLVSGSCVPPVNSEHGTLRIVNNPQITFQPVANEICENGNTNFTAAAIGPELVYRWQVDTGSGFTDISDDANYSGSGTSSLAITNAPVSFNNNIYRLEVRNACVPEYTDEVPLIVNANPTAGITGDGNFPLVCGGYDLNLDGNPQGGTLPYLSHNWTGSVGPLSTTLQPQTVFNTLVHGDFSLTYTVTDDKGCKGTSTVTIENNIPDARFISNAVPSCGFIMVDFTNQSTGAVSYEWDFDDGSPVENTESPSHGFENMDPSGQVNYYEVKLTATSDKGCSDVATQIVTIYPKVDPTFEMDPVEGCHPMTATLVTQPGAYAYEWNYGDGITQSAGYAVVHEFRNLENVTKTYEVKLTTTSYYGCKASATKPVTVHPMPQPTFTVSPLIQTYPDATVNITNLVNPGPWEYMYRFGDGNTSTQESPEHTYTEPGTYRVTQIVSTAFCSDSASQSVIINPAPPVAGFIPPTPGCTPLQISFVNTSEYATSYIWDFGDGGVSTKKDPVYIYFESGDYNIRLTVSGPGGSDFHTETIQVYETPTVGFSFAPDTVFEDYKPAQFFNFTVGSTTNYLWDFGDIHEDTDDKSSQNTSSEYEPSHVYEHPGWKDVRLIAYNENCSDTLLKERAILVLPRKDFKFPNVFRPNPGGPSGGYYDRTNPDEWDQVFFPGVADDVIEYFMYIYNRWGELVFESKDINQGWDGYINNRMAAQGVYVWKVKGKYLNGENFVFAGNVTLLH